MNLEVNLSARANVHSDFEIHLLLACLGPKMGSQVASRTVEDGSNRVSKVMRIFGLVLGSFGGVGLGMISDPK